MKNIFINMKNNSITDESGEPVKSTMLFALENNATYIHVDYTGCGVDTWMKVVDFETAEGTKYQFRLNEDLIITIPLPNTLMKEGRLKINPLAVRTDATGNVLRYSGFTYSLTVGSVVDAFDQEFEIVPDIITQLAEEKADKVDVYTKSETYTKDEVNAIAFDAELVDYYNKSETDSLLDDKADKNTVYNKSETDSLLDDKADKNTVYTKTEVDSELVTKADKTYVDDLKDRVEVGFEDVDYQLSQPKPPTPWVSFTTVANQTATINTNTAQSFAYIIIVSVNSVTERGIFLVFGYGPGGTRYTIDKLTSAAGANISLTAPNQDQKLLLKTAFAGKVDIIPLLGNVKPTIN